IHFVEGAVGDGDFDIHDRIAREDAAGDGFLDAVSDGGDVLLGNRAADDFVFNLNAFAAFIGFERDAGMAVLAAAAGLADELAFAFGSFGDRFAIGDLRRAGVGADFEFAEQTVANDLQVEFAHAGDNNLPGLLVGKTTESRIFLGQALQALAH